MGFQGLSYFQYDVDQFENPKERSQTNKQLNKQTLNSNYSVTLLRVILYKGTDQSTLMSEPIS